MNTKKAEEYAKQLTENAPPNRKGTTCYLLNKCPDQIVGHIVKVKGEKENIIISSDLWIDRHSRLLKNPIDLDINQLSENIKTIVIVLESPHIDEFKTQNFPAPAMGSTGYNLSSHFHDAIVPHIEEGKYMIVLMNSIQYQCSLGVDPKCYRDAMWLKIWYDCDGQIDFENELKRIPNIEYIFNLCTKGEHYENEKIKRITKKYIINSLKLSTSKRLNNYSIQSHVQAVIDDICGNAKRYTGPHPSSWWRAPPKITKV